MATTTGVRIAGSEAAAALDSALALGMLEGMTRLVPTAEVGFLGMARNEETGYCDVLERSPE